MPLNTVIPDRLACAGAGTRRQHQRQYAKNESKRRHQDRAKARARRLHRRFQHRPAIEDAPLACNFHDQNGVLGRERDQQHETDLRVKIVLEAKPVERGHGPSGAAGKVADWWIYDLREPKRGTYVFRAAVSFRQGEKGYYAVLANCRLTPPEG